MKTTIIILSALIFCASVQADIPAYAAMRDWVEKSCATNAVPKDERVFIGHGSKPDGYALDYASILRYDKSISLRKIIDGTPFKGTTVTILVMRPDDANRKVGGFFAKVKPSDKPDFKLKPLDVIWIYTDTIIF